LSFFFWTLYCLSSDLWLWLPLWYIQTFLINYIRQIIQCPTSNINQSFFVYRKMLDRNTLYVHLVLTNYKAYTGFDINSCPIARGKWKWHLTCPIGQVKMILWYAQFLKSKMINIELFSVGSRGEFYLNIASYVLCILRHFVLFCWLRNSLFQIKIVLFILANREFLIRRRRCINIVFIFAGQWKARVICCVLIYPWCVLPLRSKYWKRDRLLE
jgi:hypothetical protein